MTNPNDIYKQAVLDLQSHLGRPPTTRDPEYVRLGEELRLAWGRMGKAEETVLSPRSNERDDAREATLPTETEWEEATAVHLRDAREAGTVSGYQALSGPGAADKSPVAPTGPGEGSGPGTGGEPVMVGGRGPSGGIYAVCQACQQVWERPATRGRPARKCEECRR